LDDVPPRELATLVAAVALDRGWDDEEGLFRAVMSRLGLHRLTSNVDARLKSVLALARSLAVDSPDFAPADIE
jgi:hypothetical protein